MTFQTNRAIKTYCKECQGITHIQKKTVFTKLVPTPLVFVGISVILLIFLELVKLI